MSESSKKSAASEERSESAINRLNRSLLDEFAASRRDLMRIWGPGFLVGLIVFGLCWIFLEPAPPDNLIIVTGPKEGAYYRFANEYAKVFAKEGVHLEIRESEGSIENYRIMKQDQSVHLAIVQGGTAADDSEPEDLEALASLYLEPVWVFYRADATRTALRDFKDARVAIGNPGSGTRALAERLFADNGLSTGAGNIDLQSLGGREAATAIQDGKIDGAVFVMSGESPLIHELVLNPDLRLLSFDRHQAYCRRYPFLTSIKLDSGVLNLERNIPDSTVYLLAPAANLIATPDLHDAFIPLLLKAARKVHYFGGMFVDPGDFPSLRYVEFEVNDSARQYFENGPSFLQRYIPFWVVSAIDRSKILLLPLLTLVFPLVKLAPPIYRWQIRSRIYQWYRVLRQVDQRLKSNENSFIPQRDLKALHQMEHELDTVTVPLAYMQEFYMLRMHLELVRRRLESRLDAHDEEPTAVENEDHRPEQHPPGD